MVRILIEKPTIPNVQNACLVKANPPYVDIYIYIYIFYFPIKIKSLINGLLSFRRSNDQ